MFQKRRNAFSMLELIFVIVIIGIISAIAVPKFAATSSDAVVTKAKSTVAAVRSAVATERQKRILRGNFDAIEKLASDTGEAKPIFDDMDGTGNAVLEYPLTSCEDSTAQGCWITTDNITYTFRMPVSGDAVDFNLTKNRFICKDASSENCKKLTL